MKLRDKDSNLDLRVQSAVSWPLDDPGWKRSVVHATRLRFDPGSHRHSRCRASSWRRSGARRSLPDVKSAGKSSRHRNSVNYRVTAGEDLSLSGGASIQSLAFFKLSITSFVVVDSPSNDKGDPLGSPTLELLCG